MSIAEVAWPALTGLAAAFAASVLLAVTKRWHGKFSFDTHEGSQKFHNGSIPRIGGVALFAGLLAAAAVAGSPARSLLFALGVSSLIGFAAGLAEDLSKKVSPALRLLATMLSASTFCVLTGYSVTRLDIPLVDGFMSLPLVSIAFTVFVMAGLANAVNIIDGFHGLAAGTVVIMLCALGTVAFLAEDHDLALVAVMVAAVLSGFLLVNFPFGYVFLGDGGAYLIGLVLGAVAVMLAARNPGVSAWTVAVVLAYPIIETLFSIARKMVRIGHAPTRPDEVHLHMLVYRSFDRESASRPGRRRMANPLTGASMWVWATMSLIFVALFPHTREWALAALAVQIAVYAVIYYRCYRQDGRWAAEARWRPESGGRVGRKERGAAT